MPESGGLFVIDAETGDTSQFTGTNVSAGNGFTVDAAYKNNGTYGFRSIKEDTDVDYAYGYKSFSTEADIYVRCYIYVSSDILGTAWQHVYLFKLLTGPYTWSTNAIGFGITLDGDGAPDQWRILGPLSEDGGSTTNFSVDEWHRVEMRYVKHATTGGAQIWVDGTSILSDIDNDTSGVTVTDLFCGMFQSPAAGFVYIDDIKADTSYIGAYSAGGGAEALAGGIASTSDSDGMVWRSIYEKAAPAGTSDSDGAIYRKIYERAAPAGVSTVVGNILEQILEALAGTITAVSSVTGAIWRRIFHSASPAGVSTVVGNIVEQILEALAGTISGVSSVAAAISRRIYPSGGPVANAGPGGMFFRDLFFVTAPAAISTVLGNIAIAGAAAATRLRIYMKIHRSH